MEHVCLLVEYGKRFFYESQPGIFLVILERDPRAFQIWKISMKTPKLGNLP